jgi:hypothetical protein
MNTTLNTETTPTPATTENHRSGGLIAGAILIGIGLLNLVKNIPGFNLDLVFLPILAGIFLAAGLLGRKPGLLVPGGILMGIGVFGLLEGGLSHTGEMAQGGAFFLALASGFALITLAGLLIGQRMLWPLFPAAGTAAFGAILLLGLPGLRILELSSYFWPVLLIALGVYLVLRRR